MKTAILAISTAILAALAAGCSPSNTYTLYRDGASNSQLGVDLSAMRIHVASFDASESEDYNLDNCQTAQQLFQSQPGVTVRYWCEKGRYKK